MELERDLKHINNGLLPYTIEGVWQQHKYGRDLGINKAKEVFCEEVINGVDALYEVLDCTSTKYDDYVIDDKKLRKVCNDEGWWFTNVCNVLEESPYLALKKIPKGEPNPCKPVYFMPN